MKDENFLSFCGNGTGLVIRKYWNEEGGGTILREEGDYSPLEIELPPLRVPEGVSISDLLKASHICNVKFICPLVDGRGAKEDAIDTVACKDLEYVIQTLYPAHLYCTTTKGQSERIRHEIREQIGHGHETDHDYGNAVNPDIPQGRTTGCSLNVRTHDRSSVDFRVLHAHVPKIENPDQLYDPETKFKGFFGFAYPIVKFLLGLVNVQI